MATEKTVILLIEDDAFLLSMYSTKFDMEGYEVLSANDGEAGLRLATEAEKLDIVILDIKIPKMSGFEVLENLKKNDKTKAVPVILLTNVNQQEEIKKGISMGADDYLIKAHFMPSEVVEKIKKVLKK